MYHDRSTVITEENRISAAVGVARKIPTSVSLSFEDIVQDAWIELGNRMGKPFPTAICFTAFELKRKYYGRNIKTKEEFQARCDLYHDSVEKDMFDNESYKFVYNDSEELYDKILKYIKTLDKRFEIVFKIITTEQYTDIVDKRIGDALGLTVSRGNQIKNQLYKILRSKFPELDPVKQAG